MANELEDDEEERERDDWAMNGMRVPDQRRHLEHARAPARCPWIAPTMTIEQGEQHEPLDRPGEPEPGPVVHAGDGRSAPSRRRP